MRKITINCDMGEAFGIYRLGDDEACMPFVTHANVACGGHAGWSPMLGVAPQADGSFSVLLRSAWTGSRCFSASGSGTATNARS